MPVESTRDGSKLFLVACKPALPEANVPGEGHHPEVAREQLRVGAQPGPVQSWPVIGCTAPV